MGSWHRGLSSTLQSPTKTWMLPATRSKGWSTVRYHVVTTCLPFSVMSSGTKSETLNSSNAETLLNSWPIRMIWLHLHKNLISEALQLIWYQDLGRDRPCSSSETLKLHQCTCILLLHLVPSTLPGAPNHCPGWQPWKPPEIYEGKWNALADFHEI